MKKSKKEKKVEKSKIRDIIADFYEDVPLLFMDPEYFDEAIIGVATGNGIEPKVAYDYDKVIKINMKDVGTMEDAIEWFEFNQIGAYVGEHTPVFIKTTKAIKEAL